MPFGDEHDAHFKTLSVRGVIDDRQEFDEILRLPVEADQIVGATRTIPAPMSSFSHRRHQISSRQKSLLLLTLLTAETICTQRNATMPSWTLDWTASSGAT